MKQTILEELDRIEAERGVRVLLAVESGSRAWGMASADSDHDVRFVYVRTIDDYLRLEETRDVIEWRLDEKLDVNGWDIVKFLRLLRGSNPSAFEWLASDIIYRESPDFAAVREVARECFSPVASAFHFLGIAKERERVNVGREMIRVKSYLYAVRAILAARYVLDNGKPSPVLIDELTSSELEPEYEGIVSMLTKVKRTGDEKIEVARMPGLDDWIEREGARLAERARAMDAPQKIEWSRLDGIFRELVRG